MHIEKRCAMMGSTDSVKSAYSCAIKVPIQLLGSSLQSSENSDIKLCLMITLTVYDLQGKLLPSTVNNRAPIENLENIQVKFLTTSPYHYPSLQHHDNIYVLDLQLFSQQGITQLIFVYIFFSTISSLATQCINS